MAPRTAGDRARYLALQKNGASAEEIYRLALADGWEQIETIKLLRELFGLDLVGVKKIWVKVAHGKSLYDYQAEWGKELEKALEELDEPSGDDD